MELVKVELHNFTSYADAEVDLTNVQLAALVGQNGAGKSSIIDAFLWCLYGEATKGGTKALDNYVRRGEQECRVAVEFTLHGERYRVIRHRSAGKNKTMLELYRWSEPDWQALSAKTVTETQEMVVKLLRMDYRTFTASSLILQGKADSLTSDMTDAERKEVLARILGLDLWDRLQEAAREKGRETRAAVRSLMEQTGQAEIRAGRRTQVENAILDQTSTLKAAEQILSEATGELNELEGQERQRPMLAQQETDLTRQVADRTRDREQAQRDAAMTQAEIADKEAFLRRRGEIEAALPEAEQAHTEAAARLESVTQQVTELEVQVRQAASVAQQAQDLDRQIAARERDKLTLTAEGQSVRAALEEQQGLIAQGDAIRAAAQEAAARSEALRTMDQAALRYADLDRQCREAEAQVAAWDREHDTEIARLDAQVAAARTQSETLGQVPCGSDLQPRCPLLAGARAAAGDLDKLLGQVRELQRTQNPHADEWMRLMGERDDLGYSAEAHSQARQRLESIQRDAQRLAVLEVAEKRTAELSKQREQLKARHDALMTELLDLREQRQKLAPPIGGTGNLEQALQSVRQRLAEIKLAEERARDRLSRLRQSLDEVATGEAAARERLERLRARLVELGQRTEEIDGEIASVINRRTVISAALASLDRLQPAIEAARTKLGQARQREADAREHLGRLRQELAEIERAEVEAASLRERLKAQERQAYVYEILDQAAGKKGGVPALIMEAVVPQIEAYANDLLSRIAGGRLMVRLDTQAEGKSTGTMQEVLRITVLDGGQERPYVTFSGAERFMVDLTLRVALSKFLAHRSGAEIRILVLDEGLGALDGPNRHQVMTAIHEAAREFSRVIVITHIAELQDSLPQRIEVTRGTDGSSIKVVA